MRESIKVNLQRPSESYEIYIGRDILMPFLKKDAVYIVDANVFNNYRKIFSHIDIANIFILYANEESKTIDSTLRIIDFLLEKRIERKGTIYAVGGGITGDVAAFAASIYLRGVPFIQIATTLLSMVDSSVGGKTGVNYKNIKNIIGTFYQPKKVIIDTQFIDSLSDDEYLNGLAEIIKMAFLFDRELVNIITKKANYILKRDKRVLEDIIKKTVCHKVNIVERDEKESNLRQILNFGHTLGHAIEVDSNYSIKHGFAVAIGMILECRYGYNIGVVDNGVLSTLEDILRLYDFQTKYKFSSIEKFKYALERDKKTKEGFLTLSLPARVGCGKIIEGIKVEDLLKITNNNG
ncbi:MAG: 3-dehydroquinate synthase [Deferribacterota bacterium]|nr:3-dehydroquinate synthase [Deferribacterota bacterium]